MIGMKAARAVGTLTRPGGWYGVRELVPALNAAPWMEEHVNCDMCMALGTGHLLGGKRLRQLKIQILACS